MVRKRHWVMAVAAVAGCLAFTTSPAIAEHDRDGGRVVSPDPACPFPLNDLNRPVAPRTAPAETATFTDPTADVQYEENVTVAQKDYIAPFARLIAGATPHAGICVEEGSNVQDNTTLQANGAPVHVGRNAIIAHGATLFATGSPVTIAHRDTCETPLPDPDADRDPMTLPTPVEQGRQALANALAGAHLDVDCDEVPAFIGFNALNRGHIEDGAMLGVLSRLDRGLTLPTGFVSLPGVNIDTPAEASDPGRGKVRLITPGDVVFMAGVLHVNECLARGYSGMYRAEQETVFGIGPDPGGYHHCEFNATSELPTIGGQQVFEPRPSPEIRIIGDARIGDISGISEGTSIRADEGEPFTMGFGNHWGSSTTFHALEATDDEEVGISIGDRVTFDPNVVIHGGGRRTRTGGISEEPTTILDGSRIGPQAVVFRSFLGPETHVGFKAAIVGYDNPAGGERIPPRCVKFQETPPGACAYFVEW